LEKVTEKTTITVFVTENEFDTSPIHHLCNYFDDISVEVRIRSFDTNSLIHYENSAQAMRFPAISILPLFLPWLIEDKCLFLDADTLVMNDVKQLFDIDLCGHLIGGVKSSLVALSVQRAFSNWLIMHLIYGDRRKQYIKKADRLGFSNVSELGEKFFGSGVILFDNVSIRYTDLDRSLMNMSKFKNVWADEFTLPDMDRLNQYFKDKVHYLDLSWDVAREVSFWNSLYTRLELYREIKKAMRDPSILHFTGLFKRKSWKRPFYRGLRYRLYRTTCQKICQKTGIDVIAMFNDRC